MSQSEQAAAEAVVRHHEQLAGALRGFVDEIVRSAETGGLRHTWQVRDELVGWVRAELLPHAYAEEAALYPAAAREAGAELLIRGMLAEHVAITALVTELTETPSPVAAATAARALQAVFEVHLAKENDLVVPALVASTEVSLAELLAGMHELIGAEEQEQGCGCGCGCGHDEPADLLSIEARAAF